MSRIIAGRAGGIRLAGVAGDTTRPTTDRVKEALFSRLESYGVIEGARVLDLFAGSGALGCEALSRGAAHVDFIETSTGAQRVVKKNMETVLTALRGRRNITGILHRGSARTFLTGYDGRGWDLVFIDPPYTWDNDQLQDVLGLLPRHLREGSVLVVERSSRTPQPRWPDGVAEFSRKKYGETVLYYTEPAIGSLLP